MCNVFRNKKSGGKKKKKEKEKFAQISQLDFIENKKITGNFFEKNCLARGKIKFSGMYKSDFAPWE